MRRRVLAAMILLAVVAAGIAVVIYFRPRPPVFAVIAPATSDPSYTLMRDACIDEARRLRVVCEFAGPEQPDGVAQAEILNRFLGGEQRVQGLAVAPVDPEAIIPALQRTLDSGIPVVTFASDTPGGDGRLAFVGTDDETVGIELGRLLVRFAPQGAVYAIITGNPGAKNLNARIAGIRKQLAGQGPYAKGEGRHTEVSGSPFPTGEDSKRAAAVVGQVVAGVPRLNAIIMVGNWAHVDPKGYIKALGPRADDVRSGRFVVVAFGMLETQLKLLKEGYVTGLIGPRPDYMVRRSLRLLDELARNKEQPVSAFYHAGIRIVTKDNVDIFLR